MLISQPLQTHASPFHFTLSASLFRFFHSLVILGGSATCITSKSVPPARSRWYFYRKSEIADCQYVGQAIENFAKSKGFGFHTNTLAFPIRFIAYPVDLIACPRWPRSVIDFVTSRFFKPGDDDWLWNTEASIFKCCFKITHEHHPKRFQDRAIRCFYLSVRSRIHGVLIKLFVAPFFFFIFNWRLAIDLLHFYVPS